MKKKNTGIPYENLAQKVFNEIVNQDSVKTINVEHNVTKQGKTTSHQIDVYWEFEVGGIKYCSIVQAKDWTTAVKQGEILQFKAVLDDLPGQPRGVFVTKSRYQKGALDVANANGILLYVLREPIEADWEGKIKKVVINLHAFVPRTENLKVIPDLEWAKRELQNKEIEKEQINASGMDDEIFIYDSNYQPIETIKDVKDGFFAGSGFEKFGPTNVSREFDDAYIKTTSAVFPFLKISKIEADISTLESISEILIDGESIVGCILKNVLDGSIITFDSQINLREKI